MRGALAAATLVAGLLVGCGSAPSPATTASGPFPPADALRITAPAGLDRWEPSGGVVRGDRLWVVNDREGWIAAYALPLAAGRNAPVLAHQLRPHEGRIKFEAASPAGEAGLFILDTTGRGVWRCDDPANGCPNLSHVDIDKALDALEAATPKPVKYVTYEAMTTSDDRLFIGSRGYETVDGAFLPWALLAEPDGRLTYDGTAWTHDGRGYGLSDMARIGDTVWMTWSYEGPGSTRADVAGLLARAPIDGEGRPGEPVLCRALVGKPEGVVEWGERLLVIFDVDRDRKDPNDPTRFALAADEDRVEVYDRTCPLGAER